MKKETNFNFKDLVVWQRSIDFAHQVIQMTEKLNTDRKHFRLIEQVEASSASIAQNIAEGKGRHSTKEFIQFLYYSRGSLFETITLLNLFHKMNWIRKENLQLLETQAQEIGMMTNGLISKLLARR